MTRAQAAAIIGAEFATLLVDASMTAADTTGNLKEPLDSALRSLGTAEADLATTAPDNADAEGFLALVRYWALFRVVSVLASNFNISTGGTSLALKQQFDNAMALLELWKLVVESIYGSVTGAGSALEWVDTGYLELNDESYATQYLGA